MKNASPGIIYLLLFGLSGLVTSVHCSFAEQPSQTPPTIAIIQPRNVRAYQQAVEGLLSHLRRNIATPFNTVIYENPDGFVYHA